MDRQEENPSFSTPNMLVSSPYMPTDTYADYSEMNKKEKSDLRVVSSFDSDKTSGYDRRTPHSSPQVPRKSSSASSPMSPRLLMKNIFGSKDKSASSAKDKENFYGSPKIGLMSDQDQ
jgi:hypothetical protein